MKKALICFLLSLAFAVSLAQTAFSNHLLNGDIKMKEHFYEMALLYYQKAISVATSPDEVAEAEHRIQQCRIAMTPVQSDEVVASSNPGILFSDQYLETGDYIDQSTREIKQVSDETAYPLSLYKIEVRRDALVIISHEDQQTSQPREDVPAGTILPLVEETDNYRHFSSEKDGENFIVFKRVRGNSYGQYRFIYRELNGEYYVLYPMAYVKNRINNASEETSKNSRKEKADQEVNKADSVKVYPIVFTESWFLNLTGEGERIGDSRTAPLRARDVCWLMFRIRYSCPDSFMEPLRFDLKVMDSSGKLIVCSGQTTNGYSSSKVLETIPGGGIFNIAIGKDEPGSFHKGKYTLSLWCENVEYYSAVIELE